MQTDIVIATHNRLEYLKRTVTGIFERTMEWHRLHVINDGSNGDTVDYLDEAWDDGFIHSLVHRRFPLGIARNLTMIGPMTQSAIVVYTDDDVLCPDLDPDWLVRGLEAMNAHPDVGLLGLNVPSCNLGGGDRRKKQRVDGAITRCVYLGGQFLFMRRALLDQMPNWIALDGQSPVKNMCRWANSEFLWGVAYLTDTYCWHFGTQSARSGKDISESCYTPGDLRTLVPPQELKG